MFWDGETKVKRASEVMAVVAQQTKGILFMVVKSTCTRDHDLANPKQRFQKEVDMLGVAVPGVAIATYREWTHGLRGCGRGSLKLCRDSWLFKASMRVCLLFLGVLGTPLFAVWFMYLMQRKWTKTHLIRDGQNTLMSTSY